MAEFNNKDQDQENSNVGQNSTNQNQNNTNQNQYSTNQNEYNMNQNQYSTNQNQYNMNQNQYSNNQNQYSNNQNPYNNNQNAYGNRNNNGMNNQNPYQNTTNNSVNNQTSYNKVPDYSFWAEQVPNNSYPNFNQGNNSWQYNDNMTNKNEIKIEQNNQKKHGGKAFKLIAKALCFGIIAGVSFIGFQKIYTIVAPNSASSQIISTIGSSNSGGDYKIGYTDSGSVQVKDKSAINAVTDSTLPSIVQINSKSTQAISDIFGQQSNQEVEGSGSGIIVNKTEKELLIATNNHVVEGATKITVTFSDGSVAAAEVKGTDSTADLAVVTVDLTTLKDSTLKKISVAKLGNSNDVKVGQMAIAIGNALGYGQSVTVGYISAKDREVEVSDGYTSKKMVLLQTDAAINPGNSGGALLNVNGEVIGINTVKYASEEVEGMGYSIPISKATPIIKELMNREVLSADEQGYLGVAGQDVTEEASKYYNIPIGVYVEEVSDGGAAQKAGLKAEDIITKVNDIEVTSMSQLKSYVNSLKVGTKVEVTYMRNTDGKYKSTKVTITLGKNPQLTNSGK